MNDYAAAGDERRAYLTNLAIDSLSAFNTTLASLEITVRDIKSIVQSLDGVAEPALTASIFKQWARLEIIFAIALDEGRSTLRADEQQDASDAVAALHALFRSI